MPIFRLDLERSTKAQITEAFKIYGAREGVLRKCENFFVQAAQDAGIELSQYILARRHTKRASTSTRPRQTSAASSPARPFSDGLKEAKSLAEMVLEKYPDFDPTWDAQVQAKWLEGIGKLYENLRGTPAGKPAEVGWPDPATD